MKKKGVSPVIATVLLIGIVIILAAIIFLWARGFVAEKAQKFERAVELSCANVNFRADVFGNDLDIINDGNVPIYGINVKIIGEGRVLVKEILDSTIGLGESKRIDLTGEIGTEVTELLIVPIILGETGSGKVSHECADQYGFAVAVI